jgi:hypothetical protein
MTETAEVALNFSPFHTVLWNGFDQMFEFAPSQPFLFLANGDEFQSTLTEAILLSPEVCELLRSNPLSTAFEFPKGSIKSEDLGLFLDFVRSRDFLRLPRDRALSFLSISERLGNESLSLSLLSSLNLNLNSSSTATSPSGGESAPSAAKSAPFSVATIEECAAQFFSCSIDQLRCLDRRTLHRIPIVHF